MQHPKWDDKLEFNYFIKIKDAFCYSDDNGCGGWFPTTLVSYHHIIFPSVWWVYAKWGNTARLDTDRNGHNILGYKTHPSPSLQFTVEFSLPYDFVIAARFLKLKLYVSLCCENKSNKSKRIGIQI